MRNRRSRFGSWAQSWWMMDKCYTVEFRMKHSPGAASMKELVWAAEGREAEGKISKQYAYTVDILSVESLASAAKRHVAAIDG